MSDKPQGDWLVGNILDTCERELNETIGFMLTEHEAGIFAEAIRAEIARRLPEKEDKATLCQCEYPTIVVNEAANLIWCDDCNKQYVGKSWNECLSEVEGRLLGRGGE